MKPDDFTSEDLDWFHTYGWLMEDALRASVTQWSKTIVSRIARSSRDARGMIEETKRRRKSEKGAVGKKARTTEESVDHLFAV